MVLQWYLILLIKQLITILNQAGKMKKLIKEYLKVNAYNKGQIYKICPEVMLNDFVKYVERKELKNEVSCYDCGWEGKEEELKANVDLGDNIGDHVIYIKCCPNCRSEELVDL